MSLLVWGLRLPNACPPFSQAGLGRTGTLIALYLMKHHSFTALEAMGWLRLVRPGSVIGPQQHFLVERESAMWRAGELFRNRGPKEVLPHDTPSAAIADFVRRSFPVVDDFIKHLTHSGLPCPASTPSLQRESHAAASTPPVPGRQPVAAREQSTARRASTLAEHVTKAAGRRSIERYADSGVLGRGMLLASALGDGSAIPGDMAGSDLACEKSATVLGPLQLEVTREPEQERSGVVGLASPWWGWLSSRGMNGEPDS